MKKVRLLDVCDVYQPQTIATKLFIPDGKYMVYGANGEIGRYDKYNHEEPELLMACRGATCGAINISKPYSWINGNAMVIHPNGKVDLNKDYLKYYLVSVNKDSIISGTAQPQITRQNLKDFKIIICDIDTQKQIVQQIEEQLSKLDSAVKTLKKTKQQLEVYRQAVLKEAFQHFTSIKPIREKASLVTSGSRGWAKFYNDKGARFIRIGNLNRENININLQDVQYVKLPDNAEGTRSKLEAGDILVSITADLGSIGLVRENIGEAYINQHIALVRLKNKIQSEFIAWYLRSDIGQKQLLKNKRGAGKLGLGLDDIRDTLIPDVSSEIAFITIRKIEEKLSVCNSIEQTVNQSLQQAEALRQSILKQAFEGML